MDTNTKKLHPLLMAAAISVTVFSAVGIAAITGLIPHSQGQVKGETPVAAAEQPAAPAESVPAPVAAPAAEPMPAPKPATPHVVKAPRAHKAPQQVAMAETPALTPPPPPVAQAPQVYEAPKPGVYGVVESVREVEVKGDAKGVGAVGGGLAGAVLGHNIGDHNKLVTVLGAAGGALLGNQIEKTARATKQWEMIVRYDDGTTQTFKSEQAPFWHQGDRVRLYEGKLQPV